MAESKVKEVKSVDEYADVKADAERLTKARHEAHQNKTDEEVRQNQELEIVPLVQAATPKDAHDKKQNTGGVDVKGSPEKPADRSDEEVKS